MANQLHPVAQYAIDVAVLSVKVWLDANGIVPDAASIAGFVPVLRQTINDRLTQADIDWHTTAVGCNAERADVEFREACVSMGVDAAKSYFTRRTSSPAESASRSG